MNREIQPIVSILIPCFNSRDFVGGAIESSFKQSYTDIEVIVIDDGSTDGSFEFVSELKQTLYPELVILRHPGGVNLGVSSTRYRGAMCAKGHYIAFLDADDQFEHDKIAKQLALLASSPDLVLCHTGVKVIGDCSDADRFERNFGTHCLYPYNFRRLPTYLEENGICNSSVLVKADVLRQIPFAMPQLFQYEDWLCWSLVSAHGKFIYLDESMTRYRVHAASATAAVLKSEIRKNYSLLELKLALAIKSESTQHSILCFMSALRTIIVLLRIYGNAPLSNTIGGKNPSSELIKLLKFLMHSTRKLTYIFKK